MNLYLVTVPDHDGSYLACCQSVADLGVLPPEAVVYLLGLAHSRTPPGILALVSDVWGLVPPNCKSVTPAK